MRKTLIAEYHTSLAGDEGLTAEFFARLKTMMRARRLLYGAREIGEEAVPHAFDNAPPMLGNARLNELTQMRLEIAYADGLHM